MGVISDRIGNKNDILKERNIAGNGKETAHTHKKKQNRKNPSQVINK